jgi:hypothetical protein
MVKIVVRPSKMKAQRASTLGFLGGDGGESNAPIIVHLAPKFKPAFARILWNDTNFDTI